jgi:hypothetical protein
MKANCIACGKEFEKIGSTKTCSKECSHQRSQQKQRRYRARLIQTPEGREILAARGHRYLAKLKLDPVRSARAHARIASYLRKRYAQKKLDPVLVARQRERYAKQRLDPVLVARQREYSRARDRRERYLKKLLECSQITTVLNHQKQEA